MKFFDWVKKKRMEMTLGFVERPEGVLRLVGSPASTSRRRRRSNVQRAGGKPRTRTRASPKVSREVSRSRVDDRRNSKLAARNWEFGIGKFRYKGRFARRFARYSLFSSFTSQARVRVTSKSLRLPRIFECLRQFSAPLRA